MQAIPWKQSNIIISGKSMKRHARCYCHACSLFINSDLFFIHNSSFILPWLGFISRGFSVTALVCMVRVAHTADMFTWKMQDSRARHVFSEVKLRTDLKSSGYISQDPHPLIRILSAWDTNIPGGGKAVCSAVVSSGNVTSGSQRCCCCGSQQWYTVQPSLQFWSATVSSDSELLLYLQFIQVLFLPVNTWINSWSCVSLCWLLLGPLPIYIPPKIKCPV